MTPSVAAAPRDAAATRQRILAAAAEEFAARGLSGARIDEIAAKARANKRLIYCYVGDKDDLFAAVLDDRLAQFGHALEIDPDDVAAFVGSLFDAIADHPEFGRLMMWEALELEAAKVPNEPVRCQRLRQFVAGIEEAQRRGTVAADLDPAQLLVTLHGLAAWWFAAPQLARMATGSEPRTKRALARRREHAVDAARRLITPPPKIEEKE